MFQEGTDITVKRPSLSIPVHPCPSLGLVADEVRNFRSVLLGIKGTKGTTA